MTAALACENIKAIQGFVLCMCQFCRPLCLKRQVCSGGFHLFRWPKAGWPDFVCLGIDPNWISVFKIRTEPSALWKLLADGHNPCTLFLWKASVPNGIRLKSLEPLFHCWPCKRVVVLRKNEQVAETINGRLKSDFFQHLLLAFACFKLIHRFGL